MKGTFDDERKYKQHGQHTIAIPHTSMIADSHSEGRSFLRARLLGGWSAGEISSDLERHARTSNNEYGKKNTVSAMRYCLSEICRSSVI